MWTMIIIDSQAIEWVPFVDLPTWTGKKGPKTTTEKGKKKFYNVTPFVG